MRLIRGFRDLLKVFIEFISNLVCVLFGWVFRNDSIIGPVAILWSWRYKWVKSEVSGRHLKIFLLDCLQTLHVCLSYEYSEMIQFKARG